MDEDLEKTNLNTLKEMVLDEDRLVTYVSLSKELCIHVNDSKRLLTVFVENTKKNQPNLELNINFIISGLAQDNKARTTVASEKEINEIRKSLRTVFFEHVYSCGKGVTNVDSVALLAVNRFEDFPLYTGLIKNSSCMKRSSEEIDILKSSSQVSVPVQKPALQKKEKEENKQSTSKDTKNVSKPQETKSQPVIKTEIVSPKKDTSTASTSKTKFDNKKNGVKPQKGIAGFFSKSNSAPSKTISKETIGVKEETVVKNEVESPKKALKREEKMDLDEEVPKLKKDEVKSPKKALKREEKMDLDEEMPKPRKVTKEQPKAEVKNGKVNGKERKSNEKLSHIKKNAKVDKKRKRVLHVSDSESDEEKDPFVDEPEPQEQHMSDDEIPPTPTVNTVKITSGIINPKKRRKVVDKTYTDEDGYILTKKEEVYESCSDNEEDSSVKENIKAPTPNLVKQEKSSPKKNASKNSKKKISPPQKGKQATLMNFFKKL